MLVVGCSQDTTKLISGSGTLTRQSKPLANVRIEFVNKDSGALSFADTDEQGRFDLRHALGNFGIEPGTYRVSVFRMGKPIPPPPGRPEPGEQRMTPDEPILMSDKSPIEITVADHEPNTFDIDIK